MLEDYEHKTFVILLEHGNDFQLVKVNISSSPDAEDEIEVSQRIIGIDEVGGAKPRTFYMMQVKKLDKTVDAALFIGVPTGVVTWDAYNGVIYMLKNQQDIKNIKDFEKIYESDGSITFMRPIPGTGDNNNQQFAIVEETGYIRIIKQISSNKYQSIGLYFVQEGFCRFYEPKIQKKFFMLNDSMIQIKDSAYTLQKVDTIDKNNENQEISFQYNQSFLYIDPQFEGLPIKSDTGILYAVNLEYDNELQKNLRKVAIMPFMNSQEKQAVSFDSIVDNEFYFHLNQDYVIRTRSVDRKKQHIIKIYNSKNQVVQHITFKTSRMIQLDKHIISQKGDFICIIEHQTDYCYQRGFLDQKTGTTLHVNIFKIVQGNQENIDPENLIQIDDYTIAELEKDPVDQ